MPTDRSVFVERLLQVNLAALAALGTLMLGMGERSATMPLVMLCVAGGSIWLTDVTGLFRLNRLAANLGALVIGVFILTREFSRFGSEVHILGVAHLLVYLQILLLLQKKRQREYVQLAVLSLLQVVVASAFSQGVWFGVVLAVYMMAGLSALVLLFLFRQWTVFEPNRGA
ncbi:MAG: transglutaminaseTgpA domain-containing protein, partial [Thermoguttaceae bacterium]|nr:transglutaminaseTgpA domain-containing protein [Thermoguttaceae bacterium]